MHKKATKGDNSKSINMKALFLSATHRHNLFYKTVKYHQNIPNGFLVTERTRKCLRTDVRTDARLIAISFRSGDEKQPTKRIPRCLRSCSHAICNCSAVFTLILSEATSKALYLACGHV